LVLLWPCAEMKYSHCWWVRCQLRQNKAFLFLLSFCQQVSFLLVYLGTLLHVFTVVLLVGDFHFQWLHPWYWRADYCAKWV
jgi:hypothetical protein